MLTVAVDNSQFETGICEINKRGEVSTRAWRFVLERNLAVVRSWPSTMATLRLRGDLEKRLAHITRLERQGLLWVPIGSNYMEVR